MKITRDDLIIWIDRPPSNSDLEMCNYIIDLQQRIDKAKVFCDKQKQKMYKNRNKIALFILLKLEKIINGTIGE
jgi:SMC interacting uncharacterized protein involved in chromosome segregation